MSPDLSERSVSTESVAKEALKDEKALSELLGALEV
jgi:hypothetical protein